MKYVVANWKMNMGLKDIKNWVKEFEKLCADNPQLKDKVTVILAPSTIHIPIVAEVFNDPATRELIQFSAQDCAEFELGAHTGYDGAFQLKEFCKYSIIGHSERKESFETALLKRDICLQNNLIPIICFPKPEYAQKAYKQKTLVVWEDPSNISRQGRYVSKEPLEIAETAKQIRERLPADAVLLYGGSVNRQNMESLAKINQLNGVLVGNASLDPSHFFDIVHTFAQ